MADLSIEFTLEELDMIGSALDYKSSDLLLHEIVFDDLDNIDQAIWNFYFYMRSHKIKSCKLIAEEKSNVE